MPCSSASPPPPQQAPRVLAFDTSTERLAVALGAPEGSFCTMADGGALASANLLPQARRLLDAAGLSWADLGLIAFGAGPGAFTGLRTACAVAQGLALGLGLPVLPIDSLLIVAEDARAQCGSPDAPFEVAVAMDARMDEVYAARYLWNAGRWQALDPPALLSLAAVAQAWAGTAPQALAGSAPLAFGDRVLWPLARRIEYEHSRAAALLRLALQQAVDGGGIDAALALPLYLRDKVAFTTQEREAARLAKAASA